MPKHLARLLLLTFGFALIGLAATDAGTAKVDPTVQKTFDKLITAVKDSNRDAFLADASEVVKKGFTKEAMEELHKVFGERLKKGYQATYLCELKQVEHQIHLWKMTFKDGGDDMVVRLALKDGKVGGFFLQ